MHALDRIPPRVRRHLPLPITVLAAGFLLHGVDLHRAGAALGSADWRWVTLGLGLTVLSVLSGTLTWGMLVRHEGSTMSWRELVVWSARAMFAGQLVPGGAGGDAVRTFAVGRVCGTGAGLGANCGARVSGSLGMALWGVAGAVVLREAIGPAALAGACGLALALIVCAALALHADRVVAPLGRHGSPRMRRMGVWLEGMAAHLASFRRDRGLLVRCLLAGCAGWGLELAALVALGHGVGAEVGWPIFAVALPVTLTATLMPLSANGVGVKEGILVGLLVRGGVAAGPAAALSLLVDVQYIPVALAGGLCWLRRLGERAEHREPGLAPAPSPAPAAAGEAVITLTGAATVPVAAPAALPAPAVVHAVAPATVVVPAVVPTRAH